MKQPMFLHTTDCTTRNKSQWGFPQLLTNCQRLRSKKKFLVRNARIHEQRKVFFNFPDHGFESFIPIWFSATGRRMNTVINIYIGNLAIADVIIAIFCIPFQFQAAILQRWDLPDFMCKLCPFIQVNIIYDRQGQPNGSLEASKGSFLHEVEVFWLKRESFNHFKAHVLSIVWLGMKKLWKSLNLLA